MIDGIFVLLAFAGILLIYLFALICLSKPEKNAESMIIIKDDMSKNEICNIVYGLYFKSFFCGDCVCKKVYILDLLKDKEKKSYLYKISEEFSVVKIISVNDLKSIGL